MIGIYLSGTGNTKHCVEKLVNLLDAAAECIPLEAPHITGTLEKQSTIILGYPTQFSNAPFMVRDFIRKNRCLWNGKSVFCLNTMGLFSGDGTGCVARLLWELTDTNEYHSLLERFSLDATLYEQKDSNALASFLFYTLEPLTAEKWQTREFRGGTTTDYPGAVDNASLEFVYSLTVQNADTLTVGEYNVSPVLTLPILDEIDAGVTVGTAGSSLLAVQAAVKLLDWGMNTGLGADEISDAASTWLAAKNNDLADCLKKLELVDNAYQKLLTDEARELLDSAGCEKVEIIWGSAPVEPIEAIMQAAGLRK